MRQKFYRYPWATAGDRSSVPDPVSGAGFVSYQQGWTFDYQRTIGSDAAAKSIVRQDMNAALYDVTLNVQAIQTHGYPEFITAANNGGTAYPYDLNAIVLYSASGNPPFGIWISTTTANSTVPGAGNWKQIDGIYQNGPYVRMGTGIGQAGNIVYIGWTTGAKLKLTIDTTDLGNIALESWVNSTFATQAALSAEVINRTAADTAEASVRSSQDTNLQNDYTARIAAEAVARNNEDVNITNDYNGQIAAEANIRSSQDTNLQNDYIARIAAEATARNNQDTNIINSLAGAGAGNGLYNKLGPNGIIIQNGAWITFGGAPANVAVNFPIPFPNGCTGVVICMANNTGQTGTVSVYNITAAGFVFAQNYIGGQTATYTVEFIAMGS